MEPLRQSLYHWHRIAVSLYKGHIAWPLVVASAVPDRVTYSPVVAALLLPSTRETTPIKNVVPRFQAERTFAWFQKKYRSWVVRWERITACLEAFLAIATIHIWMHRLVVGYMRSIFPYTGRCREGDSVPFLVGAQHGQTVCSGDL
jgi:hypothetical protein